MEARSLNIFVDLGPIACLATSVIMDTCAKWMKNATRLGSILHPLCLDRIITRRANAL